MRMYGTLQRERRLSSCSYCDHRTRRAVVADGAPQTALWTECRERGETGGESALSPRRSGSHLQTRDHVSASGPPDRCGLHVVRPDRSDV